MHIPDGFVSGPINIAGAAVAVAAVGFSAWRTSRDAEVRPQTVPLLAMTAAFVFAAQMLNFPIGGGTSGHFLGATFVAALLGGTSACLALALVLVIQCLGFADGGITALGANIVNMGVIGGVGGYAVMRLLRCVLPAGKRWFLASAALASWLSVVAAATACSLELALSGTSPLAVVIPAMVGAHVLIGLGEALITLSVLSIVAATRPDLLPAWTRISAVPKGSPFRRRVWGLAVVGLLVALALAFFASPFASRAPDGLDSLAASGHFGSLADVAVWTHALMPDYSVPGVTSESLSTSLAGLLGTACIFVLGFLALKLFASRSRN